jgi:hypothetical protein
MVRASLSLFSSSYLIFLFRFALNSGSDLVTFCPTDVGFATGTFEAQVYGYLEALSTVTVTTASKKRIHEPYQEKRREEIEKERMRGSAREQGGL